MTNLDLIIISVSAQGNSTKFILLEGILFLVIITLIFLFLIRLVE